MTIWISAVIKIHRRKHLKSLCANTSHIKCSKVTASTFQIPETPNSISMVPIYKEIRLFNSSAIVIVCFRCPVSEMAFVKKHFVISRYHLIETLIGILEVFSVIAAFLVFIATLGRYGKGLTENTQSKSSLLDE